jgi:GH25 family lysozyme M1 (1,4-beta-N-acetylmuramidase)
MWRALDAAGIPFGVYSVEGGGLIAEAAQFKHAGPLIYRALATDVAPYELSPEAAAGVQWSKLMAALPPEVKALKDRVWIEIGNEQDKTRAEWLGWYYVELAGYAARDGYKMSAFAWSTGEPEPAHWQYAGVLAYLRLCAAHPERLAVSVHEYSLSADDIMAGSPWLVGRVKFLFEACQKQGIASPVVFVSETGWTHNDLPQADKAKADIVALAGLYAIYPTVKAAFLWTAMGGGDKRTLAAELNALLPWLTDFAIDTRWPDGEPEPEPEPDETPVKVIDISKWQGVIYPDRMRAAGVDGVIPRGSYGVIRDQRVDGYVGQLQAAALSIPAVYHYYEPDKPWRAQLDTLLAVMRQHQIGRAAVDLEDMNFGPAARGWDTDIDLEEKRQNNRQQMIEMGIDPDQTSEPAGLESAPATVQPRLVEDVRQFMEALDREMPRPADKPHLIYTNYSYWLNIMGQPDWGVKYQLWIAAWTNAAAPVVPKPWGRWTLWQFTSSGDGPAHGVQSARVDVNRFNGDRAAWAAWQVGPTPAPVTFAAALWQDSRRAVWGWNPDAALAKRILADGYIPTSYEFRFEHGGRVWLYQVGHSPDRKGRRVYYVEKEKWDDVRWIRGPSGASTPPAPVESMIDMIVYFMPLNSKFGDILILANNWGQGNERVQLQSEGDIAYIVKNSQYEKKRIDATGVYQLVDTSPGNDEYFTIQGQWLPRRWKPGDTFTRWEKVHFYRKADCTAVAGKNYESESSIRFDALLSEWTSPAGVKLQNVIKLSWILHGVVEEEYWYAPGLGLCQWKNKAGRHSWGIERIPVGSQENNIRETIGCLSAS